MDRRFSDFRGLVNINAKNLEGTDENLDQIIIKSDRLLDILLKMRLMRKKLSASSNI